MTNKILVPIDFEQQSLLNIKWAKFYAKKNNAELILTHIIEENSFLKKLFREENFEKKIFEKSEENIKGLINNEFKNPETIKYSIEKGKTYEVIEDLAEELEPDMIIIGRNETTQKKSKYLGSNTLHIISETDYPVVSIYGDATPDEVNDVILMPVDVTGSVSEQVSTTIEFAKLFNSKVKVICVDEVQTVVGDTNILVKMNKIKETFIAQNIEIETEIIENHEKIKPIFQIITEEAEKTKPLFVTIMLRDEQRFRLFNIGSVAQEIIMNCKFPVLSIKPWDAENEINPVIKTIINPFKIYK